MRVQAFVVATAMCLLGAGSVAAAGLGDPEFDDCSAFVLDNRGQAIFACNYDMSADDDGMVFIHKRGTVKTAFAASTTGEMARWTATYGSIAFSLVGNQHAWAGMNERGLAFSTMRLDRTVSPPPDHRPPVDWLWPQYILDTCETVDDVIASDALVRTETVDHYLFADRFGGVAVIEFLDGRMVSHTGPELCVAALTNTTYSQSCEMWERLRETRNYRSEDFSIERFCLAADRVAEFTGSSTAGAVDFAFESLRGIYRLPYNGYTRWSIVFDTLNLRAYFKTKRSPEIRWVDLEAFDLRCGCPVMMLGINEVPSGDVTGAFTDYDSDRNLEFREAYYRWWRIPFDHQDMLRLSEYLESFPCRHNRRPEGRRVMPVKR
jgi:penicillin V acylase-like amidase (Ntn superfamily)